MLLGRVVGAHGVRGELRVRWLGDGPGNLLAVDEVDLADPARGPDDPTPRHRRVTGGGLGRQGEVRLALEGVEDRDAARALLGCWVAVPSEALPPLPEGEFYWYELVGCRVETAAGEPLGTVEELWETGAHDVLVVRDAAGRRHLVPAAREILREVDRAGRRLVVDPPEGLLEPEGPTERGRG